jgi:hypothetical protein
MPYSKEKRTIVELSTNVKHCVTYSVYRQEETETLFFKSDIYMQQEIVTMSDKGNG